MEEEGGISWPLKEGYGTNPISCFPTHTYSKTSLYLSISKLHGPGPIIRWRGTYNSLWTKCVKWHLVYFIQAFMHLLWWLQSPEIITWNSVLVSLAHAIISMLVLAPMFILLQARPFTCKKNKDNYGRMKQTPLRNDEDINTIVTPTAPAAIHTGPITRARARQLNYQVLSFLGNDSNVH